MSTATDQTEPPAPRRVFILGAGFSKAVSNAMPLTDELGAMVIARLADRGETLPVHLTRGHFEDWLSRLAEDQPDQWEEENFRSRGHFAVLARTIGEVLDECEQEALSGNRWLTGWLDRFVAVMHAWRSTVITFNYDTLIERAVDAQRLLDFDHDGEQVLSCDVIGQVPPPPTGSVGGPFSSFRLLKLHGSLAWWWAPEDVTGTTVVRWPREDGEHLAPAPRFRDVIKYPSPPPRVTEAPAAAETEEQRRSRLLPGRTRFLVPPAALKSRYYTNPFTRELWRQARTALAEGSEVYLVGYSLPRTDLVTLGMLREQLSAETQVFIVNLGEGEDAEPDESPNSTRRHQDPVVSELERIGIASHQVQVISGKDCVRQLVDLVESERVVEAAHGLAVAVSERVSSEPRLMTLVYADGFLRLVVDAAVHSGIVHLTCQRQEDLMAPWQYSNPLNSEPKSANANAAPPLRVEELAKVMLPGACSQVRVILAPGDERLMVDWGWKGNGNPRRSPPYLCLIPSRVQS